MTKIALVEVFAAPQGEGHNAGRSAVFVRLAGCPLACEFAPGVVCDTPYMQANMKLTMDELFILIASLVPEGLQTFSTYTTKEQVPMLIFTGGEPTASQQFDNLVTCALDSPYYIAVETNGVQWRDGLKRVDWITVSPKEHVAQTSQAPQHNHNPQDTAVSTQIHKELARRAATIGGFSGEYRYVIAGHDVTPPYYAAPYHYISPAVLSDGSGEEWKAGFPGFAPGAVANCLSIIKEDPRWRISIQSHKVLGVR